MTCEGPPSRGAGDAQIGLPATLTEAEVAQLVRVDRRTLRRWRQERLTPAPLALPGAVVRYWRREIEDWLAGAPRS